MATVDLSVILPNFNHARFLPRALGAILTQSVSAREVIVVDDASTDDSMSVLEGYAKEYPNLRVVRHERNRGVTTTLNTGLALATGRYAYLGAADDYVLPGFFEKACALLDRHPDAGLCYTFDSYRIGDGPIEANPSGWSDRPGYFRPEDVCRLLRHCIPGHCSIIRREPLLHAGKMVPQLEWYADWFVNLTIAFRHGACHIPETLAVRVLMPQNYSADAKPGERNVAVLGVFFDRITAPELADVAPYFRRNGAATYFGTDLVRAAARRGDCWEPQVLGFLNGFRREQYEELLADPDPTVRELAGFFLGPFWREIAARREQQEAEVVRLRDELERTRQKVPPPGATGKFRWLAGLVANRLRRAAG